MVDRKTFYFLMSCPTHPQHSVPFSWASVDNLNYPQYFPPNTWPFFLKNLCWDTGGPKQLALCQAPSFLLHELERKSVLHKTQTIDQPDS